MVRRRSRLLWAVVAWTLLLVVAALVVAGQAIVTLYDGQQACFFNYPAVPCPHGDDPAVARLTFAFFVLPAIWLGGILVAAAWALRRRRNGAG